MTLTDFQAVVCTLIGAGSVAALWGFVTLLNWSDRKK